MDYIESENYLNQISRKGSVYGLQTIQELLKRLGNPQNELKFIHVAGTNGKGSTIAFLSSVLKESGYCVGRFNSPHLVTFRECIQVNEEYIEEDFVARCLTEIRKVSDSMASDGLHTPTYFEVETALAFLYFKEKNCDLVLLETGLGGRMDATNIISTAIIEVFVSISMDHMDILGDTLEKIALEKSGIIKPHTVVVSASQKSIVEEVLSNICKEKECDIKFVAEKQITNISYSETKQQFTYKDWENIEISLLGTYQIKNASLALEVINVLKNMGYQIEKQHVIQGMKNAAWWGRFTCIATKPTIIIDGAHNEEAAEVLKNSIETYFKGKRIYYIFGVFKDKAYRRIIELTAPLAYHIITVQTKDNPRALPAEQLKQAVAHVNSSVESSTSISQAVQKVMTQATCDDVIVIFGSLSFLESAKKIVLEGEKNE